MANKFRETSLYTPLGVTKVPTYEHIEYLEIAVNNHVYENMGFKFLRVESVKRGVETFKLLVSYGAWTLSTLFDDMDSVGDILNYLDMRAKLKLMGVNMQKNSVDIW